MERREKSFSLVEALRFGFYMLIEHFAFFLGLMLTYIAVMGFGCLALFGIFTLPFATKVLSLIKMFDVAGIDKNDMVKNVIKSLGIEFSFGLLAAFFFCYILNRYLALGFARVSLDFYDKDHSTLKRLFFGYKLIFKDAVASSLYWLLCSVGFLFFIVPGIYFAIRYMFYHFVIVDTGDGPLDALRKSSQLTDGVKWELFAFWILIMLINWAGFSTFGITMLITWPLSSLAYAYVYRKLSSKQIQA